MATPRREIKYKGGGSQRDAIQGLFDKADASRAARGEAPRERGLGQQPSVPTQPGITKAPVMPPAQATTKEPARIDIQPATTNAVQQAPISRKGTAGTLQQRAQAKEAQAFEAKYGQAEREAKEAFKQRSIQQTRSKIKPEVLAQQQREQAAAFASKFDRAIGDQFTQVGITEAEKQELVGKMTLGQKLRRMSRMGSLKEMDARQAGLFRENIERAEQGLLPKTMHISQGKLVVVDPHDNDQAFETSQEFREFEEMRKAAEEGRPEAQEQALRDELAESKAQFATSGFNINDQIAKAVEKGGDLDAGQLTKLVQGTPLDDQVSRMARESDMDFSKRLQRDSKQKAEKSINSGFAKEQNAIRERFAGMVDPNTGRMNANASRQSAQLLAAAARKRDGAMLDVEKDYKLNLEKFLRQASQKVEEKPKSFGQMTKELEQKDRFERVTNLMSQTNPKTGAPYTAMEASSIVDREIKSLGKEPGVNDAFKQFQALQSAGQVQEGNELQSVLGMDGVDGNVLEAQKVLKAGGYDDATIKNQLSTYRKDVLGLSPENNEMAGWGDEISMFKEGKGDFLQAGEMMKKIKSKSGAAAMLAVGEDLLNSESLTPENRNVIQSIFDDAEADGLIKRKRQAKAVGAVPRTATDKALVSSRGAVKGVEGVKPVGTDKAGLEAATNTAKKAETGDFEKVEGVTMQTADYSNSDHVATLLAQYNPEALQAARLTLDPDVRTSLKDQFGSSKGDKKLIREATAIQSILRKQMKANDDMGGLVLASSGGKNMTAGQVDSIESSKITLNMLGDLGEALDKREGKSLLSNISAGKNPFSAEGREVKAILTGLVPKLARGTFGEVGVLTDADTRRYEKLLPTLTDTEDVRKVLESSIYRVAQRGFEEKLDTLAKSGVDVSGFYPDLIALKNKADETENSVQVKAAESPVAKKSAFMEKFEAASPEVQAALKASPTYSQYFQ